VPQIAGERQERVAQPLGLEIDEPHACRDELQKLPSCPHQDKVDRMTASEESLGQAQLHPLGTAAAQVGKDE
jgi:hypothetical protein